MNRQQRRQAARLREKMCSKIDRSTVQGYQVKLQENKVYRYVIDYPTAQKAYARAIVGPVLGWWQGSILQDDTMFHYICDRWRDLNKYLPELANSYGFVKPDVYMAEEHATALINHFSSLYGWHYETGAVEEDDEEFKVSLKLDTDSIDAINLTARKQYGYLTAGVLSSIGEFGDVGDLIEVAVLEHGELLNQKPLGKRFPENKHYKAIGLVEIQGTYSYEQIEFYPHQITAIYPTKRQLAAR